MRPFFSYFLIAAEIGLIQLKAHAQYPEYQNGYEISVMGETIAYNAPDPRARNALLVRSQDSTRVIRWETNALPIGYNQATVSFVWLFGMDASPEQHVFVLSANGLDLVKFGNPSKAERKVVEYQGLDGSRLQFRTTMIDRNKDALGYAVLTLPIKLIQPGKPVLLQVRGRSSGSNIWYMTFQYPVQTQVNAKAQNLMIERDGARYQAILAEIVNLEKDQKVKIQAAGQPVEIFTAQPGYNAWQYFIPEVNSEVEVSVDIRTGSGIKETVKCPVRPVIPWTVYLVQHTHTDIGYTRPQSEILPEHLRFIDYALDFCDQTDQYPEDAQFRWTCESAWAVDQYLKQRPDSQIERLLNRIREGRIEVTAMPFNMSEIADETALRQMLIPVQKFHEKGIEVSTAMQDDVNGIGWCLADYFPDIGVKYLIMGEHGHRARIPFDLPTAFWWASPSGKKILAYRGEHYMYGNFLLLHTGDLDSFRSGLLSYLDDLSEKGYPFKQVSLQYSGYVTDNSPPALIPNKVIRDWNEMYVWPKLRSATAGEFMKYVGNNHGSELELIQKAWPDWWTDGFGSAARETAAAREAQTQMNITSGLLSMAAILGTKMNAKVLDRIEDIYDKILFYDEHTFGAAESISSPYAENSMEQWAEKSSYAWEALKKSRMLREEAFGLLQEHVPRYEVPSISVFNTLNWARSGLVEVYIDHEMIEPGEVFSIQDTNGQSIPAQAVSSRSDGTYWILWAENIPAMGYKSYKIVKGAGNASGIEKMDFSGKYENNFWSVDIDRENGALNTLIYKDLDLQLVDMDSPWKPGQLIYERLSDRHQLELFTLEEEPQRTSLSWGTFTHIETGAVQTKLSVSGTLSGCARGNVEMAYHLYHHMPVIEITYRMIKEPVTDPEALYVAFPFGLEDGEILFDVQGGNIRPGLDQLPGTASDWNTVQNFVSVRTGKNQLLLSSPDIPLFHLGGLNLGNFSEDHQLESHEFYSWVLNNYWTTNFRAYQEGEITWRYLFTISEDPDIAAATRFGWESRIPMVGRVLPKGEGTQHTEIASTFLDNQSPLLLVNSMPNHNGDGIIFHLREISGETYHLDPGKLIKFKENMEFQEVNALGENLGNSNEEIVFSPFSVHFLEIKWKKS